MGKVARILVLALASVAPVLFEDAAARAATDTAICGDLNAVIAEAGSGFDSLRGTLLSTDYWQQGPEYAVTAYAALRTLPGAASCLVEYSPSNQTYPKTYTCAFAPAPTKVDAMEGAASAIADCIGKTDEDNVDIDRSSDVGSIDWDRPNYKLGLSADDRMTNVRLVIFPK
jgi:hypothetical protein